MSFIFLYGKPGSGKSTLVTTMTKLGYKIAVIDADRKMKKMSNISSIVSDPSKVEIWTIDSALTQSTMRQRVLAPKAIGRQPQGYLEFCDMMDGLEEAKATKGPPPGDVLVIDSLSSVLEHLDRLVKFVSGKDHFEFTEWAQWLSYLEEFFWKCLNLLEPNEDGEPWIKHIIITAHELIERDDITGKIEILPMIPGSMRHKVSKYFEEVYHLAVDVPKTGEPRYTVLTKSTDRYEARTSRILPTYVESDFTVLFAEELHATKQKGGSDGAHKAKK